MPGRGGCPLPLMFSLGGKKAQRNFLLSLSFANLVYLRAWADLVPLDSGEAFLHRTVPGFGVYAGLSADVLLLALILFIALQLTDRAPRWFRRLIPAAAVGLMSLGLSFLTSRLVPYVPARVLADGAVASVAIAMYLAWRYSSQARLAVIGVAWAGVPCVVVTFIAPLFFLNQATPPKPDQPPAQRSAKTPPVRVIWVVFDEWDQKLSFTKRSPDVSMPVIDGLASRSFSASNALAVQATMGIPVNHMATAESILTLLYERPMVGFAHDDPEHHLTFQDGDDSLVPGAGVTVFSKFRANGWNVAAAGWYLPYCRYFGSQLADCTWDQRYDEASSTSAEPVQAAKDQARLLLGTAGIFPFGPSLVGEHHFSEYQMLMAAAKRDAADASIGLTFIHLNIPHEPYFYDPAIGHSGRRGHPNDLYNHALSWVDRSVGEILSAVEKAGLDSKTAVILSSDHPVRFTTGDKLDPHVPFIVHLPGYEIGTHFEPEFSALKTGELALAIAKGEIPTPAEVGKFLIRQ